MKHALCIVASIACLSACNKGPSVELHNATGNQVTAAVKQSGVMSSDTMIEPGLWQSKVTVQEMNIPGLPAEYAAKMKQTMAEHRNDASSHCVTAADVKKPKEDFFGADKSCRYEHFTMGAGKIDAVMRCGGKQGAQEMQMAGTYSPDSYQMQMATEVESSDEATRAMQMQMRVEARRVGECTAKQG
jgi:hypothetical protein